MWLILIGVIFQYISISINDFLLKTLMISIVSSTIVTTGYSIQD